METAYLVHGSSGRLRLRVPARRHDRAWFAAAETALLTRPGILAVQTDADRAVLTLHLQPTAAHGPQRQAALTAAGIRLAQSAPPPALQHAAQGPADARTQRRSGPELHGLQANRRTLALGVFLLLLTRQLLRSGWLIPGLALAWVLWESLPVQRGQLGGAREQRLLRRGKPRRPAG